MKKSRLNCKGFMLVEVIVSTVVVVTIMTTLYVLFNRVYNYYELKSTYTNVNAIYTIKTVEDFLIDEMKLNDLLNSLKTTLDLYEIKIECDYGDTECDSIFAQYKINSLYLMKKKNGNTISVISDVNQTFKDYIEYLNNAVITDSTSDYLFVVETYEIDSLNKDILNNYAYLEVK